MLSELSKDDAFKTYYKEWIAVYKEGAVRQVTMNKYLLALTWVERLAPDVTLGNIDRIAYQHLLKNKSSTRKVQIDWQLIVQFSVLVKELPEDKPLFIKEGQRVYNSTANDILARLCKQAGVPVISIHGLRHTHASLLLFAGVSIASVAKRLGHTSMNTTEKTYLHIIQELENKDVDLVMRSLTSLV